MMKPLVVSLLAALSLPAVAQMPFFPMMAPQAAAPADAPKSAEQWAERMMDFTQNGASLRDPAKFAAWSNAMTDPSMVAAMGAHMMEPGNMLRSMTTMMQPGTMTNQMQFMDPAMAMRWGTAMMNPMYATQMATSMADPGKVMRWVMLPMDPKMMAMGMQMMNPNNAVKWMMTPTDPRAMSLMFAPMNPQLYGSMMGGVINTKGMGGNWGTFMNPAQPVVSVQPAAPVSNPINVFDPSTWFSMMNMFGGMPGAQGGGQGMPMMGMMQGMPMMGMMQNMPMMNMAQGMPMMGGNAAAPTMAAPAPAAFAVKAGVPTHLSLSGDALFKTGKASLTAEGKTQLHELVGKIKAYGGAINTLKVVGHADKMGNPAANQKLSQARAKTVAAYLKAKGIKAVSFMASGAGDTQPVVNCDMALAKPALKACLAPNRRVDVEVTGAQ